MGGATKPGHLKQGQSLYLPKKLGLSEDRRRAEREKREAKNPVVVQLNWVGK